MSPRSPFRRLASVAAGALVLSGCVLQQAHVPSPPTPGPVAGRPGRPGVVVAAPRSAREHEPDDIAVEVARRTGFVLVAGTPADERGLQQAWERRVLEAAQGPLRFYAEIQRADGRECAGRLDISTVGVDRELGFRLRALAELIRDAHLRANREIQRLDIQVEPSATREGVLRLPSRALHIELPRCARREWREAYTAILADFLVQAVALSSGR